MEEIRLNKYISDCGIMSRRAAEKEIEAGAIKVNGEKVEVGRKIVPGIDKVTYKGKEVKKDTERKVYVMLYKPRGYVTTMSDEQGRKCIPELVADVPARVYPCGRLDMDSEGLLILTNDGDFANQLMHPSHRVDKTYRVQVTGFSDEGLARLTQPMSLDGYKLAVPDVKLCRRNPAALSKAELLITIHEGRNRQVRRMCEIAGMQVQRLIRVQEGSLKLGDLAKGSWRFLTDQEVKDLKNI